MSVARDVGSTKPKKKRVVKKAPLRVKAPAGDVASGGGYDLKPAQRQAKKRRVRQAQVKDTKGAADLGRAKTYAKSPAYRKAKKQVRLDVSRRAYREHDVKTIRRLNDAANAQIVSASPVLKVLEKTTGPLHFEAGVVRRGIEDVKHGRYPIPRISAGRRGLKDKTTYSDVVKDLGVKNKTVAGALGLVGDVAGDPVTYATGGTASLAKKAAEKAAVKAAKQATTVRVLKPAATVTGKGLHGANAPRVVKDATKEQKRAATRGSGSANPSLAERAAARKLRTGDQSKGLTVKFAGKSVPGVTKATAVASKPVKKAVRKVTPDRAKDYAADINPNVAPRGVSKATSDRAINATRTARGKINKGERDAIALGHGIRKKIGEENYNRVVDAIEAGNLKSLPDELRPHAITLRSDSKHVRKLQRQAGVKVADLADTKNGVKGYVYRQLTEDAAEAEGKKIGRGSGTKAASSKARTEKRPLSVVREESPGKYREDLNALAAERHAHGTATAAKAGLNRDLASLGRDVKRGSNPDLKEGEAIFHVKGSEIVEVTDRELIRRITSPLTPNKAMRQAAKGKKEKGKPYSDHWIKTRREAIAHAKGDIPKMEARLKAMPKDHPYHTGLVLDIKRAERNLAMHESDLSTALKGNAAEAAPAAKPKLKFATPKGVGGRFVVLNKELVERSLEGSAPVLKGKGFIHGFDKVTGGFKRVALATPGFHVRNVVGDTAQAYVNQPGRTLGPNLVRAKRTTQALARTDKAKRALEPRPVGKGKVKTTHYGHVSYEDLADNLIAHGAARSGYTARELKELSESGGVKEGGKVRRGLRGARKAVGGTKAGEASKRALLSREDIPRIATAIHALQNGATWEQAARKVADTHFDYAHLTSFERNVARRLLPFYTWSARNIPFTAKNVVAKPGKYANFQKLREEAAKVSGVEDPQPKEVRALYAQLKQAGVDLPDGWDKHLTEWEQRNAGVPVSWKGHKFTVSIGLPLQDLNEFPGAAGKKQISEYWQKGMSLLHPVPKDLAEYFGNYSFYFRDQLERDNSPNVAAPAYVGGIGDKARKDLKVVKIIDKKTGKKVWAWPAKMDYLAKVVPGTPNYLQQLATSGSDRRGKGTGGKALAFAGVKSVPFDPVTNAVNLAYARMSEIQKEMAGLRQQGINAEHPTPRYKRLNAQLKVTSRIAFQGKTQRGDKVLPTQGGPKKIRKRKAKDSGGFNLGGSTGGSKSDGGFDLGPSGGSPKKPAGGFDLG